VNMTVHELIIVGFNRELGVTLVQTEFYSVSRGLRSGE